MKQHFERSVCMALSVIAFLGSGSFLVYILSSNYVAEYKLALGLPLSIVAGCALLSMSITSRRE